VVIASELKDGMVLRIEGEIYKVLEAEFKAGTAKLGGVVKTQIPPRLRLQSPDGRSPGGAWLVPELF
jgi:hypothetical protein